MEILLGYACLNTTIPLKMKTLRLATYLSKGDEYLKGLIVNNLMYLKNCLEWNAEQGIRFFRVSSDIVPLSTHPEMKYLWCKDEEIKALCHEIRGFSIKHGMRLSMHPGQYTLLNSPNESVVERSVEDLRYHQVLGDMLGVREFITHVGGVYGDSKEALHRWAQVYEGLPIEIRSRLRLENDDRSFTIQEVLFLAERTGVPAVFDYHHHRILPSMEPGDALKQSFATWQGIDDPKIHLSSGKTGKLDRHHHDFILAEDYEALLSLLQPVVDKENQQVYVMLEAKLKEQAVMRILGAY